VRQASESSDTSVDLKELFARVEYDRELLDDLYQIFKQEFPKLQMSIQEALVSKDLKQLQSSAHTLKGMLASMSFRNASASAFRIERMAKAADLTGVLNEVARLENEATVAQADLDQFCDRPAQ
jgi:two-component system sensor histidine kinase/response regulator